jgi:hypothetical protein
MPPSAGLRANVELSRISGYIVNETYGVAPRHPRAAGSEPNVDVALKMLHDWRSRLPAVLQIPDNHTHIDPACCILHMNYNQLIILTTRPIFFSTIKKVVAQRILGKLGSLDSHQHRHYSRLCIEAAQRNVELCRLLQPVSRTWLHCALHFLFNAAVVLLLVRLSSAREDDAVFGQRVIGEDPHVAEIGFAIYIFEQEAKTGTNYPRGCCRVLQDLKALTDCYVVTRRSNQQQHSVGGDVNMSVPQPVTGSSGQLQKPSHGPQDNPNPYQEMMTWAHAEGLQNTLLS